MVHLPVYPENAYQPMLMEAQRRLGWEVINGGAGGNFLRTALREWRPDILHVHWLHPYLLRGTVSASWARGLRFLAEIAVMRLARTRIVWTVHNLANHGQAHAGVELALTRAFARQCDLIFTHGEYAKAAAISRFRIPADVPVVSTRFPNYCAQYPAAGGLDLRSRWELKENQFVVGFLGRVEPYKQVSELIQAFKSEGSAADCLIIGGSASSPEYAAEVQRAIDGDRRIRFFNNYVPDGELAAFVEACNLMACPSRGILTSSSVPLAMSFGRPVLAPSDGCIPEEVGECGILYDSSDSEGLREGLRRALGMRSELAALGQRARQRVGESDPDRIAQQTVEAYLAVINDNVREFVSDACDR